jgi:sensor histidine kinase YesM
MKNMLSQLKQARYFLLFVFLFSYAQSIQVRFLIRQKLNWFIFTPEAAIASLMSSCVLFLILYFFIKRWQKSELFSFKEVLKIFSFSLLVFLATMKTIGLLLALLFDTFERNFNQKTLLLSTFSELMDAIIYGSFFLTYYYYQKNKTNQKQLIVYNQALAETKIDRLKAQLNPHFLFNNLNVLDQLIEEDQLQASDFLNEFAEIYRYVLQVSDKKIIALEEEYAFAKKYFNLMQYKYGTAYQLQTETLDLSGSIVPLTLQLLLENAIQHNLGTEANPIRIKINRDTKLTVSNTIVPKRNSKTLSGRALQNLKEQYFLLTKDQIEIEKTATTFSVSIPLISN